jgi:hypothetical protein
MPLADAALRHIARMGYLPTLRAQAATRRRGFSMMVSFKNFSIDPRADRVFAHRGSPDRVARVLVIDNGTGVWFDAAADLARDAKRVLIMGDLTLDSLSQTLLFLHQHPDLRSRTVVAGIDDHWLEPLWMARGPSKTLGMLTIPRQHENAAVLRRMTSHRKVIESLVGPKSAEIVLSGYEIDLVGYANLVPPRILEPMLAVRLRAAGWHRV